MDPISTQDIDIAQYDYPLPDELIARHPLAERDMCRLLVRGPKGELSERRFIDLPSILPSDAMLVYNNTRVINARLRFRKGGTDAGALIEIFCLEPRCPADYACSFASETSCTWLCFVGNSKKWKQGALSLTVEIEGAGTATLSAERIGSEGNASVIRFSIDSHTPGITFAQVIEAAGEIPIPPYLNRASEASDSTDYQTIYSHIDGSVAAPTAGLHFTPRLLEAIDSKGIARREVTLHVGAGTFQPVKSATIGEHVMHSEFISVSRDLICELAESNRPIFAVGTTSVRTLESLYHAGCMVSQGIADANDTMEVTQWYPYSEDHPNLSVKDALTALANALKGDSFVASTRIIIAPGYSYRIVDGIITNFHQPQSTLLLLVSAFTGGDWQRMYSYALVNKFRFLSYGDACLLLPSSKHD